METILSRRSLLGGLTALGATALLPACKRGIEAPPPRLVGQAWPAADQLFQRDPKWIGGDGAYSIDLGNERVLWLFGDSFVANSSARKRSDAVMVRNSLAIQKGYDPTTAKVRFYWNHETPKPSSFFPAPTGSTWLWPNGGVIVKGRLILFFNENRAVSTGLGFEGVGWRAFAIENPNEDPSTWAVTPLETGQDFDLELGSAVILRESHLYAYSAGRTKPGPTFLARWPISSVFGTSLKTPEWFGGNLGWLPAGQLSGGPSPVANIDQAIFSVNATALPAALMAIQTVGFGAADLGYQTAKTVTGPFSGARTFFHPPEKSIPNVMIYAGLMHTELNSGGFDIVTTYCANNTVFSKMVEDMSIYFPRFVRASWTS